MKRNKKKKLTEGILGQDGMVSLQRLRFSLIIDGLHTEHVLLALLQPRDIHVGVLVKGRAHYSFPFISITTACYCPPLPFLSAFFFC